MPARIDGPPLDEVVARAVSELADRVRGGIACLAFGEDLGSRSGVLVRSGHRYFVVTAAHELPGLSRKTQFQLGSAGRAPLDGLAQFRSAAWIGAVRAEQHDLLAFELETTFAYSLSADWFDVDKIASDRVREGEPVVVVGFPQIMLSAVPGGHPCFRPFGFLGPVTRSRPAAASDGPPGMEMYVRVPLGQPIETPTGVRALDTRGVSGGGVFQMSRNSDGIFGPADDTKVIGIQISQFEVSGVVRCVCGDAVRTLVAQAPMLHGMGVIDVQLIAQPLPLAQ